MVLKTIFLYSRKFANTLFVIHLCRKMAFRYFAYNLCVFKNYEKKDYSYVKPFKHYNNINQYYK